MQETNDIIEYAVDSIDVSLEYLEDYVRQIRNAQTTIGLKFNLIDSRQTSKEIIVNCKGIMKIIEDIREYSE